MIKNYDQTKLADHPYRILITDGSRLGKTNALLNLIKHQRRDIDKNYLYVKNSLESKYQFAINRKSRDKETKNLKAYH